MQNIKAPRITQPTDSYVRHYPEIVRLANKQLEEQFWTSSEMKVELDRMHMLYSMEPEKLHAIKTVLLTFLRYELIVGDFWRITVAETFPRPEVKLACSVVDCVEKAIHAEFYNQVNIVLGLDKDEHYTAYLKHPVMRDRMKFLGKVLQGEDKILATTIFGMTETSMLFGLFAILKSFQTNGNNEVPVIVRGTNQSALDEDLHGQILAEIINTYYSELGTTLLEDVPRYEAVRKAIHYAYASECEMIDAAIPGDSLNGTPKQEFKEFSKYRLNVYAERLGLPHEFKIGECHVIDWFEKNTYAYKVIDFFTPGMGMEYESSWVEDGFKAAWLKGEE